MVRTFALCAAACSWALPARAQQTIPLDIPEAAALRAALRENPRLLSAELRARGAEARIRSARSLRRPATLFLDAEEIAADEPGTANVTVGVEHEFTPSAERRGEVALAEAELVAVAAARDGVRLFLESRLSRSFLEAVVQRRIVSRLAEEDTLLQQAEATLNSRFSVGEARYLDVIRLRTERLRVQADLLDANTQLSRAVFELRALSGRDAAAFDFERVTLRLPQRPADVDSVLIRSPVVRMAAAEQARARAALQAATARSAARFTGQIGLQRFGRDAGGSTLGPALGGSVSLPFTNRTSVRSGVEAARLDTDAATSQARATLAVLRADIAAALEQIEATARRIAGVDQQLIAAAREERQAALVAYANGALSLVELLDFERSLSRAEIQLLQSYDAAIEAWDRANQLLAGVGATGGDPQ
jgi:outer membrane protein TolC